MSPWHGPNPHGPDPHGPDPHSPPRNPTLPPKAWDIPPIYRDSDWSSDSAPVRVPPGADNPTLETYIHRNAIAASVVHPGDEGAPSITLPCPPQWVDVRDRSPVDLYAAFTMPTDLISASVGGLPFIVAVVQKLVGDVDAQAILDVAPGELTNLPGFTQLGSSKGTFCSYPACDVTGSYVDAQNGQLKIASRLTVFIADPWAAGSYVLQISAGCSAVSDTEINGLRAAVGVIVNQTTIEFALADSHPVQPDRIPLKWSGTWSYGQTTLPASLTLNSIDPLSGTIEVDGLCTAAWTQIRRDSDTSRVVSAQVLTGNAGNNQWNVTLSSDSITARDTADANCSVSLSPR